MSQTVSAKVIQDGQVVTLAYTLTVEGKVIETSEGKENSPIQFIQGSGQVLPGLENALYGMTEGDHKDVQVTPTEGYGEIDPGDYTDMPRAEFPPEIPLQPGVELQLKDKEGEVFKARIQSVNEATVRLNFNHPLAGKELLFSVKILNLRDATPEELEHDHVHRV